MSKSKAIYGDFANVGSEYLHYIFTMDTVTMTTIENIEKEM